MSPTTGAHRRGPSAEARAPGERRDERSRSIPGAARDRVHAPRHRHGGQLGTWTGSWHSANRVASEPHADAEPKEGQERGDRVAEPPVGGRSHGAIGLFGGLDSGSGGADAGRAPQHESSTVRGIARCSTRAIPHHHEDTGLIAAIGVPLCAWTSIACSRRPGATSRDCRNRAGSWAGGALRQLPVRPEMRPLAGELEGQGHVDRGFDRFARPVLMSRVRHTHSPAIGPR